MYGFPTTGSYIKLRSNIESGASPMEVTFTVDSSIELTDPNSSLSASGPGQVEWLSMTPNEYRVRLTTEGIYDFTANATDQNGVTYTDTIAVTAFSKTTMDALLKAKWNGMKGALASGDTAIAATYILDSRSSKYKEVFDTLKDQLPTIFSQAEDFVLVSVSGNRAEYENIVVEDGTAYSYAVIFVKDENGLWKIGRF